MIDFQALHAYQLIRREELPDVRSTGYLLRHTKSGARVFLLENDDENKVFNIAFRTTPFNSTGVAHIMEHSVLCGSRRYPAKDPFVELVKGSMNTFLNAMTYPDKTMYPVASCNDTDFENLMHVYLDAVFFPNIYSREEIFRQEGWSYHLEDENDEITINGVVYNEMKGAFSSPDSVIEREILNTLFPDNTYHYESGGDPACIPDLTYEEFLEFHRTYYHPSNSYIYLYGNMDFLRQLDWIDREYLSAFDAIAVSSQITLQQPFEQMAVVSREYSISSEDEETDQTYLAYGAVIGTSLDTRLANAFAVLEYALLESPGAPLKEALLEAGIGNDIQSSYDSSTYQPVFSVIAKGANEEDRERFTDTIRQTLEKIALEGLDPGAVRAAVNLMEFRFREADFGSYPKGLIYGIDVYDSWLYDEEEPFSYLKALDDYAFLKEQAGTGYYEQLIRTYLLDNKHTGLIMLLPRKGLAAKDEAALAEKLHEMKARMNPQQIQELVRRTKELALYQETPSTQEELEAIPMLTRADMKTESLPFAAEMVRSDDGIPVLLHDYTTNGIAYITILMDASKVAPEDLPYLGLLRGILGFVDTEHYSYSALSNEINSRCGGITAGLSQYPDASGDGSVRLAFGMQIRTLYDELPFCFDMVREILYTSNLRQEKRLKELINKMKSRLGTSLQASGSATAATRCLSNFSAFSWINDRTGGIEQYRLLKSLTENLSEKLPLLEEKLEKILHLLLESGRMLVSFTGDRTQAAAVSSLAAKLSGGAAAPAAVKEENAPGSTALKEENRTVEDYIAFYPVPEHSAAREGFKTPGNVQYVARGGNFRKAGYDYTGCMRVLRTIMSYEYLWTNIRVMGGAYGCAGSFSRSGDTVFSSYRDPHLERTNKVYEGIPEFLEAFSVDERDMTKYVIGTMSDMDAPLTPSQRGSRSLNAWMTHLTHEQLQRERAEVLHSSQEDIRALAKPMKAVLEQHYLCALGNEEKIASSQELFDDIQAVF